MISIDFCKDKNYFNAISIKYTGAAKRHTFAQ